MNNDENLNNNSLNNVSPINETNNLYEQNTLNESVQNQLLEEKPILENEPKKKKSSIIIPVIIVLAVVGFVIFTDLNSQAGNCINDIIYDGSISSDNMIAIGYGDTQYVFDSSFDTELIEMVMHLEDISMNICYKNVKGQRIDFHVGNTTKSKMVDSFELYDRTNNKKINAKTTDDFLKELGYHSYGKHSDQAKVIETSKYPTGSFSGGVSYKKYGIVLEFTNGKKVEAIYKVQYGHADNFKKLEEGKTYTFDFVVEKDTFEPIVYTITDFK